jgi:hypothetical protein
VARGPLDEVAPRLAHMLPLVNMKTRWRASKLPGQPAEAVRRDSNTGAPHSSVTMQLKPQMNADERGLIAPLSEILIEIPL